MRGNPIVKDWRRYTENGERYSIRVYGGLHYLSGNKTPYFSMTGDVLRLNRTRWVDAGGGACHDSILKAWPSLAGLAALHLSDHNGEPMHAMSNAEYYLRGGTGLGSTWLPVSSPKRYGEAATPEECADMLARHLRIDVQEAIRLKSQPMQMGDLAEYVEKLRPTWRAEAAAAITAHGLRVYGGNWSGVLPTGAVYDKGICVQLAHDA